MERRGRTSITRKMDVRILGVGAACLGRFRGTSTDMIEDSIELPT